MELERISIVLRPRTSREAVDLGAVMLRAYAKQVWSAWFAVTLPVAVVCLVGGWMIDWPWFGLFVLWWGKPVYDRVPLYVLSRAVFEQTPTWRETLRGLREWGWRDVWRSLFFVWARPMRGLRLPMVLLEGQTSAQRAVRWGILSRFVGGSMIVLTVGCLVLELVLFCSTFLFVCMFIPSEFLPDIRDIWSAMPSHIPTFVVTIISAVAYAVMCIIEPLYVAAGFGLYITRRTQLEAWDIDLAFRRLRNRWESTGRVMVLLGLLAFGWAGQSYAAETKQTDDASGTAVKVEQVFHQPASDEDARFTAAAARVYRDPRFGGQVMRRYEWVRRHPQSSSQSQMPSFDWQESIGTVIKLLLWGAVLAALIALVWFAVRRGWVTRLLSKKPKAQVPLADIQVVPLVEELPADLATATRRLWQAGNRREALALLYRGCVAQIAAALGVSAPTGATEADWLQQARLLSDHQRSQRAVAIVHAWQYAAYADHYPSDGEVDGLLAGWPAQ